jgi:hypothetical protein
VVSWLVCLIFGAARGDAPFRGNFHVQREI